MNAPLKRNPGPVGGYHLLLFFHRVLPGPIFRLCVAAGSFIAMLGMPAQRRSSREYLSIALGRKATLRDVHRHFNTFAHTLIFRLLVGNSKDTRLRGPDWHGEEFMNLVRSGRQLLYGTFHIGCSDLLGYALSDGFCPVYMIRLRVANSHDTERFEQSYKGVTMLWANNPDEVTLGIHKAIGEGASLTMQCDRPEFSTRYAEFDFLGQRRAFPVTIYHISAIYQLPVVFCFAVYNGDHVETYAPKPFFPEGTRKAIIKAGHEHFQQVLRDVETLLRKNPCHWFNFGPVPTLETTRTGAGKPPTTEGR
jgi:predicted LPLAT superfamily acyltransferase